MIIVLISLNELINRKCLEQCLYLSKSCYTDIIINIILITIYNIFIKFLLNAYYMLTSLQATGDSDETTEIASTLQEHESSEQRQI